MLELCQADWKDSFKKRQVGVSDMTLLSTISNDAINDNLKKRQVYFIFAGGVCTDDHGVAGSKTAKST